MEVEGDGIDEAARERECRADQGTPKCAMRPSGDSRDQTNAQTEQGSLSKEEQLHVRPDPIERRKHRDDRREMVAEQVEWLQCLDVRVGHLPSRVPGQGLIEDGQVHPGLKAHVADE